MKALKEHKEAEKKENEKTSEPEIHLKIKNKVEEQINRKEKETIQANFVHAIFEEEKKKVKEKWLTGLFNSEANDSIVFESNVDEKYDKWEVNKRTKWSKKVRNRRKTIRGFYIKRKAVKKFYIDVKRYKKRNGYFRR
jgi:hypothetical protein